jgi:hypothetical protein
MLGSLQSRSDENSEDLERFACKINGGRSPASSASSWAPTLISHGDLFHDALILSLIWRMDDAIVLVTLPPSFIQS